MNATGEIDQRGYGAATARMSLSSGVAIAVLRGPVSRSVLTAFVSDWGPKKLQYRAESAVVCMDRAVLLFSMGDLYEIARRHMARGELLRPCALVVPVALMPMFNDHAWRTAQHGLLRDSFTDASRALAWAQARARTVRASANGL